MRVETTDYLVAGCGIAGLRTAIELAQAGARVVVLSKDAPIDSNTWEAQGGIAVVLSEEDRIGLHYQDTLEAGDGLCDTEAVRILVEEGPDFIRELISWGMEFDREGPRLAFTREGAHSANRVLHAGGDSTGQAIGQALIAKARSYSRLALRPRSFTADLLVDPDGRCAGMRLLDEATGEEVDLRARGVCLATGGLGRLYRETTNPPQATGDGMAIALRAGARLMDMEFVQFHPTALHLEGAPTFLLSEALRGEGAYLRNEEGERFMLAAHERAELAPRDVVSRAIADEVAASGARCVYLDLTHLDAESLPLRFPRIHHTCLELGIDIGRDRIPVYPSAHYAMGGVRTDLWGRTDVPGLYAAGEVASCGVHGANRLASNSLLEGLVYGGRAGKAILRDDRGAACPEGRPPREPMPAVAPGEAGQVIDQVREILWSRAGVVRDGKGLEEARGMLSALEESVGEHTLTRRGLEARNLLLLGNAVVRAALERTESRGAHFRRDYPDRDDESWLRHSVTEPPAGRRPPTAAGWFAGPSFPSA
jgi:L-aspartate oxidase